MRNARLKLSPPWITYVNQIKAMFGADPDINVQYEDYEIKLFVDDPLKASAISALLPEEKYFGNVILSISIVPANNNFVDIEDLTWAETFDAAFNRNPVYAFSKNVGEEYWFPTCTYVVFKNKVVQFFNDNLNDIYGNLSTLYEDIARDLFTNPDYDLSMVYFCTDIEEKVGKPLGEWP